MTHNPPPKGSTVNIATTTTERTPRDYAREIARVLVAIQRDRAYATRPIDIKRTRAEMIAATRVAYAAGYGHTPHHVEMLVIDAWQMETDAKTSAVVALAALLVDNQVS